MLVFRVFDIAKGNGTLFFQPTSRGFLHGSNRCQSFKLYFSPQEVLKAQREVRFPVNVMLLLLSSLLSLPSSLCCCYKLLSLLSLLSCCCCCCCSKVSMLTGTVTLPPENVVIPPSWKVHPFQPNSPSETGCNMGRQQGRHYPNVLWKCFRNFKELILKAWGSIWHCWILTIMSQRCFGFTKTNGVAKKKHHRFHFQHWRSGFPTHEVAGPPPILAEFIRLCHVGNPSTVAGAWRIGTSWCDNSPTG